MNISMRGAGILCVVLALASPAHAQSFTTWGESRNVESLPGTSSEVNTPAADGCPIQSPDGLSLYLASTRPRFEGDTRTDLDIWVAERSSPDDPWGAPRNLGAPINTLADDFCPTPVRGNGLFFVSRKVVDGVTCGAGDIYFTRRNPRHGWETPKHLPCAQDGGPNTALDEQGPSYVQTAAGTFLYYSSGPDIYVSRQSSDGFGVGQPVPELNSPAADIQPNVRKDGLEIVFASNRIAANGQDIWSSKRASLDQPWSAPVNLGPMVNTTANETRPSLSWDGTTLYFGRAPGPEGGNDIFLTTRTRASGG
jgi:hypothetical protein